MKKNYWSVYVPPTKEQLGRNLKYYKKESVLAPLLKFLEASFEFPIPLVIAAIIDNGIANGNKGYTVIACCILAAFAVFGLLISTISP